MGHLIPFWVENYKLLIVLQNKIIIINHSDKFYIKQHLYKIQPFLGHN